MQTRGITFDHRRTEPPPEPGDILESRRRRDRRPTGTHYVVLGVREVQRREPAPNHARYALTVARVEAFDSRSRVLPLYWYSRGRNGA